MSEERAVSLHRGYIVPTMFRLWPTLSLSLSLIKVPLSVSLNIYVMPAIVLNVYSKLGNSVQ